MFSLYFCWLSLIWGHIFISFSFFLDFYLTVFYFIISMFFFIYCSSPFSKFLIILYFNTSAHISVSFLSFHDCLSSGVYLASLSLFILQQPAFLLFIHISFLPCVSLPFFSRHFISSFICIQWLQDLMPYFPDSISSMSYLREWFS